MKIVKLNVPPFRIHKGTGQAYVNLDGRRVYLGRADTPEAKHRYARLIPARRERTKPSPVNDWGA